MPLQWQSLEEGAGKRRSETGSEAHSEHRLRGTLYLRAAVQRRGQRPPKCSGTNMTVEAT